MPFIGQDWRSPGEQWVKTHKGSWERLKLLDNASQFLGFQSSDSSSLDSDSSISDNETGLMMESDQPTELNGEKATAMPAKGILKENVFFLNSQPAGLPADGLPADLQSESSPAKRLPADRSPPGILNDADPPYTITEFNSTIKRTKNTSIQNIISHYERQQLAGDALKRLRSASKPDRPGLERQGSFDEVRLSSRQPSVKSLKQRHLFPSKSIDQPMDLGDDEAAAAGAVTEASDSTEGDSTSRFSFVKKNFEKLVANSPKDAKKPDDSKIGLIEKPIEKPLTKHLTIKQCIRKIDLNTTHQNIIRHLEQDVSLNESQSEPKSAARVSRSPIELAPANLNFKPQPSCPIIVKNTKEIAGYLSISDAFLKLDFYNAIRDIRRFNYVCKLLHLLITQNLTSLSGCATKFLFNLLEEIAFQVAGNQQNIHVLHTLLRDVQKIMKRYYCWGRPIGSTILWETHLKTIEKICQIVKNIEIKPPPDNQKGFRDLPAELIQLILLQLSDYKDLVNSGQTNDTMKSFLDEQYIWRELCKYHFSNRQIKQFFAANQQNKSLLLDRPIDMRIKRSNADNLNWEKVFHSLRKKFGLKEEYADTLFLCRHCRSLFWRQIGHVCSFAQMLKEMNKENSAPFDSTGRPAGGELAAESRLRGVQERVQQRPASHPLINNQIDLNRQINNLNRVNNNINNEINRQNVAENAAADESRFVPKMSDSIPISPEAFLKFFSL